MERPSNPSNTRYIKVRLNTKLSNNNPRQEAINNQYPYKI